MPAFQFARASCLWETPHNEGLGHTCEAKTIQVNLLQQDALIRCGTLQFKQMRNPAWTNCPEQCRLALLEAYPLLVRVTPSIAARRLRNGFFVAQRADIVQQSIDLASALLHFTDDVLGILLV